MQNAPAKIKYDHQYVIHFKSFIFLLSPGKVVNHSIYNLFQNMKMINYKKKLE